MKFIHLADLHLGKIIYQNNLNFNLANIGERYIFFLKFPCITT